MKKPIKTKKIPKLKKTKIPKNKKLLNKVDEAEFLTVIDNISKKLAYKFKFGYHDFDDMKQQITIFALQGLENYDNTRPLENFLWTHVRNRLFNFKRDNYQRPDKPCLTCPLYDPALKINNSGCSKFTNKDHCELYSSWLSRNSTKKNLMYFTDIEELKNYGPTPQSSDNSGIDHITNKEILDKIEAKLSGYYRSLYLKLKNGLKIPKAEKIKLLQEVQIILDIKDE